jgi:flagellar hook assembly protein FlgD
VTFALRAPSVLAAGTRASIRLYSVAGRLVRTLVDAPAANGDVNVAWDGTDTDGRSVAPGVYLARATVGQLHSDRKLVVIQ